MGMWDCKQDQLVVIDGDLHGHLNGEPKIFNGDLNLFIRVPKNKNKNLMRRFMYDDDFLPVLRFRGLNLHQISVF